jgi:hypothetical protein
MPNGTNKTRIIIATLSSTRRGSCAITRVGSPPISAAVELKTAWRDDTRELVFEPLDGQLMAAAATAKTGKTGHQDTAAAIRCTRRGRVQKPPAPASRGDSRHRVAQKFSRTTRPLLGEREWMALHGAATELRRPCVRSIADELEGAERPGRRRRAQRRTRPRPRGSADGLVRGHGDERSAAHRTVGPKARSPWLCAEQHLGDLLLQHWPALRLLAKVFRPISDVGVSRLKRA